MLTEWAHQSNTSHTKLDQLWKILFDNFNLNIPRTTRAMLRTPKHKVVVRDVEPG